MIELKKQTVLDNSLAWTENDIYNRPISLSLVRTHHMFCRMEGPFPVFPIGWQMFAWLELVGPLSTIVLECNIQNMIYFQKQILEQSPHELRRKNEKEIDQGFSWMWEVRVQVKILCMIFGAQPEAITEALPGRFLGESCPLTRLGTQPGGSCGQGLMPLPHPHQLYSDVCMRS